MCPLRGNSAADFAGFSPGLESRGRCKRMNAETGRVPHWDCDLFFCTPELYFVQRKTKGGGDTGRNVWTLLWAALAQLLLLEAAGEDRLRPGLLLGAAAAALGECFLPAEPLWQAGAAVAGALLAYGPGRAGARRGGLYLGMRLALAGALTRLPARTWTAAAAAAALWSAAVLLRGQGQSLVPVLLTSGDRRVRLTALRDTGNTLTDPLTGERVLIVERQAARELLPEEFSASAPAEAVTRLRRCAPQTKPRLLPYRAVGREGMLLAVRCDRVTIGGRPAGTLVAFTDTVLSENGRFQALAGGN